MRTSTKPVSSAELRKFALVTGGMIVLVFGLLLPWLFAHAWPKWPWVTAGALTLWGLVAPASLASIHKGWMKCAEILGRINSFVILTSIFYILFLPVGLLLRLFGKDPMARKLDSKMPSYRVITKQRSRSSLEKPF